MANDQSLFPRVVELSPGAAVLQHLVPEVFEHPAQFLPSDVRRRRRRAEPLERLPVPGHAASALPAQYDTKNQLQRAGRQIFAVHGGTTTVA